jgi:long-chain acyl-CoA synthetase
VIHTHALGRATRLYPEWPALVSADKRSTFRDLHDRVGRIAANLSRRGFGVGDRLALLLPNEADYIEFVHACAWLGVIVVPLNIRLSPPEIAHILADAEPKGLIRHSSVDAPAVQLESQAVIDQEPLDAPSNVHPDAVHDPEAVLALIYTSGTTGRPKGVVLTHANVLEDLDHVNYWMPHKEGGVYLHAAPMFHIADLPFLFGAPAFGACQVTIPKFSARDFSETVERERVTHTVLVPTMVSVLAQYTEFRDHDLTSLEVIGYGGSPIAPGLISRARQMLPHVKLIQVYGLSETGFLTGLRDHEHTEQRLKSCGRSCPGIDVRVVDDSGREVATGDAGELVARGTNVMPRYWNNAQETERAFRGGLFRTGDVGYQDTDGYFYILDRIKDMIVTGGENVYSGEVEAVISAHPAVGEVAVFGIPDAQWGEVVAACVVLRPGHSFRPEDLIAYGRRSLATYKVPRRVEFSENELPKSGSGKILKRVLRERFWTQQQRAVG